MKDFIKQRLKEEMIDGQNMNQGTQEMCNKMSVTNYNEVLSYVKKALQGVSPELRTELINKIKKPLSQLKQQQTQIDGEVKNDGMSGDSMPDEANTYWVMIQSAFCELGPDFV